MPKKDRLGPVLGIIMLAIFIVSLFIIATHSSANHQDPCAHEYTQLHAPGGGNNVDLEWFTQHCANYVPPK